MSDIYTELDGIKTSIEAKLKHPYLQKFIDTPLIDDDKLLLLYEVLQEARPSAKMTKNYMVTTMLVQVALDTHEQVLTEKLQEDNEAMRNRQLTVLAGVYYSTLYYYMLAKIGDVPMIRNLANAISEINEHKISVYQKDTGCIENLMNSIRQIESSLIQRTAEFLKVPNLKELAVEVCFYKRLRFERDQFLKHHFSVLFDAIKKEVISNDHLPVKNIDEQRKHLLNICDNYMNQTQREIEKLVKQFGFSESLRARINELVFHYPHLNEKVVEEG